MTVEIVRTAYHESGHALLAFAIGDNLIQVTIRRRGNELGMVHRRAIDLEALADKAPARLPKAVCLSVAVLLAGPLAEARLLLTANPDRDNDDYDKAKKAAALITSAPDDYVAQCEISTRWFLDQHWIRVRALAATLLRDRTIEGKRVTEILREARPLPRLWPCATSAARQLLLPFPEPAPASAAVRVTWVAPTVPASFAEPGSGGGRWFR